MHRLRLLLLRLSFRRAAVPHRNGTFGLRGKMDKCTFCAGGPEANGSQAEFEKYGRNRLAEGKLPACAETVLNQSTFRRAMATSLQIFSVTASSNEAKVQRSMGLGNCLRLKPATSGGTTKPIDRGDKIMTLRSGSGKRCTCPRAVDGTGWTLRLWRKATDTGYTPSARTHVEPFSGTGVAVLYRTRRLEMGG